MTTATRSRTGAAELDRISETQAYGQMRLSILAKVAFVSTFDTEDPASTAPGKHGYQRPTNPRRFPAIGRFGQQGGLYLPMLLSLRVPKDDIDAALDTLEAGDVDTFQKRWGAHALAVVDGAHRLGGMKWALEQSKGAYDPAVFAVMMFGMSFADEARMFNTINSESKPLSRSQLDINRADITETEGDSYDQRIARIATLLARADDSVWAGHVDFTGQTRSPGRVSYSMLARSVRETYPAEVLERVEAHNLDPAETLKQFWGEVADLFSDEWNPKVDDKGKPVKGAPEYRLLDTVGVIALARLAREVISAALVRASEVPVETSIVALVGALEGVDWEKRPDNVLMSGRAGFSGATVVYKALYSQVFAGTDEDGLVKPPEPAQQTQVAVVAVASAPAATPAEEAPVAAPARQRGRPRIAR